MPGSFSKVRRFGEETFILPFWSLFSSPRCRLLLNGKKFQSFNPQKKVGIFRKASIAGIVCVSVSRVSVSVLEFRVSVSVLEFRVSVW